MSEHIKRFEEYEKPFEHLDADGSPTVFVADSVLAATDMLDDLAERLETLSSAVEVILKVMMVSSDQTDQKLLGPLAERFGKLTDADGSFRGVVETTTPNQPQG